MPVEHVGEDAAEKDADGAAAGGDEAEDAHRLRALGGLGEQRHHQRERDGGDDRGSETLDGPRAHQQLLRGGETADGRRDREERDPEQEQPLVPEEVAQPSAQKQETAEGDQVRVHDPGELLVREAEVVLDRRERDADDRHVQHDHQVAEAQHQEGQPAAAVVECHRVGPFAVIVLETSDRMRARNSSVRPGTRP